MFIFLNVCVVFSSAKLADVAFKSAKLDDVSADVTTKVWFG